MPPLIAASRLRLLERFLSYGTETTTREKALVIRRARGVGLVGVSVVFFGGTLTCVASGELPLAMVMLGLTLVLALGLAIGCLGRGRYVWQITHSGLGVGLAGILGTSLHYGDAGSISTAFPALIVLAATYILGIRAALFWLAASITTMAWDLLSPSPSDPPLATAAVFGTRAVFLAGVWALASVERSFSDQKCAELEFLARYDPLTGLLNRRAFEERAGEALARCTRHDLPCALLLIDLDGLKRVNDALGHASGDAVLCEVAERILGMTRRTDPAARLGGDEFVVLLEGVRHEKGAQIYAERLLQRLVTPTPVPTAGAAVGASVGVALFPFVAPDLEGLMRAADLAMYEAKAAGGDQVRVFDGAV